MPPGHPQPAQPQPHQPPRPGRRGAGTALLVAVALAVAVGAGGTVYAVMKGGHGHAGADRSKQPTAGTSGSPGTPGGSGNADASAGPSPGDGDTAPVSPSPGADADTGEVPEAYLGTWTSSFSGQDGTHTRTMTIRQGSTGETVMTLAGAGPTYDCTWSAGLTAGGPPLELGPSRLVSGDPASCRPGERSVLDMPNASTLVRELVGSGGTPLMYTKTG
ncbi:hypothetical protein GUY61_24465 [Streptomyces sp. GC420]|nr:hypothetical protein [Streptomyces sp. GC420]